MSPKKNIHIIISRFNEKITQALLDGAVATLQEHHVSHSVTWVPGAFELPYVAQTIARKTRPSAIICLGAVIRGDTPHFDYVCAQSAAGIMQVSLNENLPVIFGVLTTNTIDQALERAGLSTNGPIIDKSHLQATPDPVGNKGIEAALAAIELSTI